jgi:type IV pilus assembly protein PilP
VRWGIALILVLALASAGCGRRTTGKSVSEYKSKRAALVEKQQQQGRHRGREGKTKQQEEGGFGALERSFSYDATGKRDPFRSFVLDRMDELGEGAKGPLEQFELSQLDVVGIVWEAKRRRALISDPSGRGYVVSEGTAVGKNDGRVISIDDNLVLVRETYVDYIGDRTTKDIPMRVRQGQGG